MVHVTDELTWNSQSVAELMFTHNIPTRYALAKTLDLPRPTVTATFDEDWGGRASARMIARMASHFRVPISRLVVEPAIAIARKPSNGNRKFPNGKIAP